MARISVMCRNELETSRWWVLVCYCAEVQSIPIFSVDCKGYQAASAHRLSLLGSHNIA